MPFPVGDYNQDRAQHADEGGDKVMRDVERSLKAIGLADHVFRRCKISVQDLKSDIDGYVSDRQNISKHEISRRILAKRAALLAIVERRKDEVVAAKKALPETIRCELISRIEERSALDPDKTLTQNQRRLDVTRYSVSDILEKYAKSHPQVFDTALAILYIVIHGQDEGIGTGIRARAFKQGRDQFQVPASDSPREFESDD